ncbi:MAG: type 4a pilus biogenesis protein PilO [Deltaproteobacteria bacterium]|nr:type 4a pilus biogenesis protein PilO [Deltaproteobacteria bacterium]
MEKKSLIEKVEVIKMPIRIAILAGTLIVLAGIFIPFVYMPKAEAIAATRTKIDDLNVQLDRARTQRKKLPKVREEMKKVDLQFEAALRLLPNDREIPELLTKISELGVDSNLYIETFRPQSDKTKGFYAEIPISLKIKGNYHDVAVFFEKVGNMERIMNIQNVNMKPEKERSTILDVTCDAITYTFVKGN